MTKFLIFLEGSAGITSLDFIPAERNLRERNRAPSPKPQSNALQDSLLYLHKLIEKRDNQRFFAFPINDLIAPDYSSVSVIAVRYYQKYYLDSFIFEQFPKYFATIINFIISVQYFYSNYSITFFKIVNTYNINSIKFIERTR